MSPNLNDAAGRRALIARLMAMQPNPGNESGMVDSLERLCRAAVHNLDVSGAAVSLMVDVGATGVVAGANAHSLRMEELQFTFGEGPSLDAFAYRRLVLTADFDDLRDGQWLAFTASALESDVRAVFAYPLQIGAITLGVFTVYRSRSGSFDTVAGSMAITFAEIATEIILDGDPDPRPGQLHPGLQTVWQNRAEIHQAQGVVMVDLGISLTDALIRMRAYAYARDMPLSKVARSIMAGDLVLGAED